MNIADTAANGGNGNGNDGAVGGGRIAIYTDHRAVNENTIAITPTVNPGTYGKRTTDETGAIYYGARPSDGFMLILR